MQSKNNNQQNRFLPNTKHSLRNSIGIPGEKKFCSNTAPFHNSPGGLRFDTKPEVCKYQKEIWWLYSL